MDQDYKSSLSRKFFLNFMAVGAMLSSIAVSAPWDRTTYNCVHEDAGKELKVQTTTAFGRHKYRIGDEWTPDVGAFKPVKETNVTLENYKNVPEGEYVRRDSVVNLLFVMARKDTLLSQSLIDGSDEGVMALGSIETMVYSELYSLIRYDIYYCKRL